MQRLKPLIISKIGARAILPDGWRLSSRGGTKCKKCGARGAWGTVARTNYVQYIQVCPRCRRDRYARRKTNVKCVRCLAWGPWSDKSAGKYVCGACKEAIASLHARIEGDYARYGCAWSDTKEYRRIQKHANPRGEIRHREKRARRALLQSDGTVTRQALGRLFREADICPYCGCFLSADNKSVDHRFPLALGGAHSMSNLVICCKKCNAKKGAMPFEKWLERIAA